MEMTDRRPIIASAKASRLQTEDENNGLSNWCKKVEQLSPVIRSNINNRNNNNNNNNDDESWTSLSRIKRTHLILYFLMALSLFHLRSSGDSVSMKDSVGIVLKEEKPKPDSSNSIITVPERAPSPPPSPFDNNNNNNNNNIQQPIEGPVAASPPTTKETAPILPEPTTPDGDKENASSDSDEEKNDFGFDTQQNVTQQNVTQPNITEGVNSSSDSEEKHETDNNTEDETKSDAGITTPSTTIPPLAKSNNRTTDANSHLSPIARTFVDAHCNLANLKDEAWYPSGSEDDWQLRAPYLIVAGVWNAGVNQLATALLKHPQIDAAKQNGFFLPKQFFKYYDIKNVAPVVSTNINTNNQTAVAAAELTGSNFNVKVFAARERMYAQAYSKTTLREKKSSNDDEVSPATEPTANATVDGSSDENTNNNNSTTTTTILTKNQHVAMDVSPGLIFYAHKTSHSILCTTPWVKIVVLLRNPIDRLYRQWSYSVKSLNLQLSLEDWMAQEMKLLQSVGMINNGDNKRDAGTNKEQQAETIVVSEKEAWEKYQAVHNVAGAIGRSLYVFQLEEWIQAYISAGKNPSEEIIILTTEDIEENPEHEYAELIQFLGLPPTTDNDAIPSNSNSNNDGEDSIGTALGKSLLQNKQEAAPMTKETRKMLRQFFKPYNKRLTELLTSNGFEGDWDKRWQ